MLSRYSVKCWVGSYHLYQNLIVNKMEFVALTVFVLWTFRYECSALSMLAFINGGNFNAFPYIYIYIICIYVHTPMHAYIGTRETHLSIM